MTDFKSLFTSGIPLIDVRAPVEFHEGHFPTSVNLPIMDDEDRHLVGIRYKQAGQEAAIRLGQERVKGEIKEARVNAWREYILKNPSSKLYCFRGGLRSKTSQQWLKDAGIEIELIPGGYKALRHYLLDAIELYSKSKSFYILGGRTGSAKTRVLNKTAIPRLDLEMHAVHKGSSFGNMGKQPAQITFENLIAIDLLKKDLAPVLVLEDESIMIGSIVVPKILFEKMKESPLVVLERSMEDRITHIVEEYVFEKTKIFSGNFEMTKEFMLSALARIQKKLGGVNYAFISKQISEAFDTAQVEDPDSHRAWVESLLIHYYDPFYDRALERNAPRVIFRGTETECLEFFQSKA